MKWPLLICLIGVDGTGKTTHAHTLVQQIRSGKRKCVYRWFHYARLLSLPLLAYARLRGLSGYKIVDEQQYGWWDFKRSFLLCQVLPWLMLVDAFLFTLVKIRLPMLIGYIVVADRYIHDILADIMQGTGKPQLHRQRVGRLFLRLVPRDSSVLLLDIDIEKLKMRRDDLRNDEILETRAGHYRRLAHDMGVPIINTEYTEDEVHARIVNTILSSRGDN